MSFMKKEGWKEGWHRTYWRVSGGGVKIFLREEDWGGMLLSCG